MLAPRTREEVVGSAQVPCAESLLATDLPDVRSDVDTSVFGSMAQARAAEDVMFLALFDDGWKVTAAGCRPQSREQPFDCTIKGG